MAQLQQAPGPPPPGHIALLDLLDRCDALKVSQQPLSACPNSCSAADSWATARSAAW